MDLDDAEKKAEAAKNRMKRLQAASRIANGIGNKELPGIKFNRTFDEKTGVGVDISMSDKGIKLPEFDRTKQTARRAMYEARGYIDQKIAENEDDNVGIESARKTENAAEDALRTVKNTLPSNKTVFKKGQDILRRKAKKAEKEYRRRLYEIQQAEKAGKEVKKEVVKTATKKGAKEVTKDVAKEEAKKEVKRQYRRHLFRKAQKEAAKQAAKEGVKVAAVKTTEAAVATGATETAKHTVGIATGTEAIFAAITAVVVIIILIIILIAFILVSIFFYTFYSENISGAMYQSEPEAIEAAELHMTYLEASLAEFIEEIEDKKPGYDGYVIEGSVSIWHNPYTLINYLSAKYLEFEYSDVESEIDDLFNERYTLDMWVEEIEQEVEKEDDDDEETDSESGEEDSDEEDEEETETIILHILHVKLTTNDSLENIVSKRMNEEEKDQYDIYGETHGGLQFMASPIGGDYYPKISSYYGYRYHPISGDLKLHRGLDIAIPEGTSLIAPINGKVTTVAFDDGGYGNYIIVKDDGGNEVRYAHMKTVYLSVGDTVTKGQTVLGESGNTGASTGPHVHVEYLINGDYHNVVFYLDKE